MFEYYNPQSNKINILRQFEVKTVVCNSSMVRFDGTIHHPKCEKCGIEIMDGEKCFNGYKNRHEIVVLRKYSYRKVCAKCGLEILTEITPKRLLNKFNFNKLENLGKG